MLEAYTRSFTAADDVCLVVKDMGVGTFYRGQTAEQRIAQLRKQLGAPEIEYIDQALDEDAMAGLYTPATAWCSPSGARVSGCPSPKPWRAGCRDVTGYGPALDFCTDSNACLVPRGMVRFPEKKIGTEPTVDFPWLAEPDWSYCRLAAYVVEHPTETQAKAAAGVRRFTRNSRGSIPRPAIERQVEALRGQPLHRLANEKVRTVSPLDCRTDANPSWQWSKLRGRIGNPSYQIP